MQKTGWGIAGVGCFLWLFCSIGLVILFVVIALIAM